MLGFVVMLESIDMMHSLVYNNYMGIDTLKTSDTLDATFTLLYMF